MEHWSVFHNLEENPFGETPNTRFFYYSDQHRHALEQLAWMISSGKGFGMLTGTVGTGKTLLCRMLLKSLREHANTALVLQPILNGPDLLEAILDDFKLNGSRAENSTAESQKSRLDRLNDFLMGEAQRGRKSILIVDDAQQMPSDSLELIRLLSNLETESQKLLHIIFVGQPELAQKLNTPELKQLWQRLSVTPQLLPLDEKNTGAYIAHRIERAGAANFLRFHPKAIKKIFEASGGIPRLINKICEGAVIEGEARQARLIDPSVIAFVLQKQSGQPRPTAGLGQFFRSFRGGLSP